MQLHLLRSEFQLDKLHQQDGEKDARTERRREDCGEVKTDVQPDLSCCDKFFFDCAIASKNRGTLRTLCQSDWRSTRRFVAREQTQSKRSVEFSTVAKRCNFGRELEENRSGKLELGTPEFA